MKDFTGTGNSSRPPPTHPEDHGFAKEWEIEYVDGSTPGARRTTSCTGWLAFFDLVQQDLMVRQDAALCRRLWPMRQLPRTGFNERSRVP